MFEGKTGDLHKDTRSYASLLVSLAWFVELIAVGIGLTISVVVALSAQEALPQDRGVLVGGASILVAALPFILVAVVELCKIPLTFAFVATHQIVWRTAFIVFVLFLCLITFETLFNGFERNFSNLNFAIDERKNLIQDAENDIELLELRREQIVKFTEADLEKSLAEERQESATTLSNEERQTRRAAQTRLDGLDYSFESEIESLQHSLQLEVDGAYASWREESSAIEERFGAMLTDNLSGSAEERIRVLSELNALRAEMENRLGRANFLTRSGVETKYRRLIQEKERWLERITNGYLGGDAIERQSSMESELSGQLDFVNAKYARRIDELKIRITELTQRRAGLVEDAEVEKENIEAQAASRLNRARARYQARELATNQLETEKRAELALIDGQVFGVERDIYLAKQKQRRITTEIGHLINQNQVFRMAMYVAGVESPVEVPRQTVAAVGLVWFGSLALIASVCGVLLALSGFHLRYRVLSQDRSSE